MLDCKTPGIPRVHGWVYDIAAGLITDFAKADATLANTWKDYRADDFHSPIPFRTSTTRRS